MVPAYFKPFFFYQTKIIYQMFAKLSITMTPKAFFGYLPQFNNGYFTSRVAQHLYRGWFQQVLTTYSSYRLKLKLVGNGYYLKDENGSILLYAGQSHLFSFVVPQGISYSVRGRKKRTLVLSGHNYITLVTCAMTIQRCAVPDIYRQKGLRFVKQILKKKEGKKKFV